MDIKKRYLVLLSILAIAIIGSLVLADSAAAKPRPPAPPGTPQHCIKVWEKAPVGRKWKSLVTCLGRHCAKPRPVPRTVTVKGKPVTANQRHVLGWIFNEGRKRKLPRTMILSAIATTTQESSATELGHGHGTSVGPFQLIDSHGSVAERQTIEFSGNWFYNGASKTWHRGIDPVTLSHRVQRSAHPRATSQWIPEATSSLTKILGPCRYTVNRLPR